MLRQRIESGLHGLGFEASTGTAPTPTAAWLLARAGLPEPVLDRSRLPGRLAEVPLACLDLPESALRDLAAMGVRSFRDGYRLPRDAVSRRVGRTLVDTMDRALGRRPEARTRYTAPPEFSRRLDFPDEVEEMPPILAGLHRLLRELEGFLQARALGVNELELRLLPRLAPALRIPVSLLSASRDSAHLLDLLEKRLEKVSLIRPVAALSLDVLGFDIQAPHNAGPLRCPGGGASRLPVHIDRAPAEPARPRRALAARPGCGSPSGAGLFPCAAARCPGRPRFRQEAAARHRRAGARPVPAGALFASPVAAGDAAAHRAGRGRRGSLEIAPCFERIESGWWTERT